MAKISPPQLLGLGRNPHTAQTDNWWEKAFDNSLKSLSVSSTTAGEISVVANDVAHGGIGLKDLIPMGPRRAFVQRIKFVEGGMLAGTIESGILKAAAEAEVGALAGEMEVDEVKSNNEVSTTMTGESEKERRRRKKAEKATRRAERAERRARKEEKRSRRAAKEEKKSRKKRAKE